MEFISKYFYFLLWALGIISLLIFYACHKKRIRAFLLGSSTGLTSLFLLHFYGGAVGFAPTLCMTNLAICSLFGIPGTVLLVLTQVFACTS